MLELITIGTELVLGFTLDTNSAFAGQRLAEIGVRISRRTSVRDDPVEILDAVSEALDRTGLVLTTGGLGPTRDDITKKVVADLYGASLTFRPEIWDGLVARFARVGRTLSETNRCQAEVPEGATVLPNPRGTAPGIWMSGPPGEVVMLPGVPNEMRGMLVGEVIPRLRARGGGGAIVSRVIRTTGVPESALADRLREVERGLAPVSLAFLPNIDGVDLRLTVWNTRPADAELLLDRGSAAIRTVLGPSAYGAGDDDLAALLLAELRRTGVTLAVAESCTGGLVGARVTAVPGSSRSFLGGVIAYANEVKVRDLGVSPATIAEHGAVSEAVAREMADGIAERTGATGAVAVTGIAGPDGGTDDKPVGTVWFGFRLGGETETRRVGFPGSRTEIRARATQYALHGLWRRLKDEGAA